MPARRRDELTGWARFLQRDAHRLALRPDLLLQEAANDGDALIAERARARLARTRRPWLRIEALNRATIEPDVVVPLAAPALALALSSDDQVAAVALENGDVVVVDLQLGRVIQSWQMSPTPVLAVALSLDGRLFAGAESGQLGCWRLDGAEVWRRDAGAGVRALSFTAHGLIAALGDLTGNASGAIALIDAQTGVERDRRPAHDDGALALLPSADGSRLLSGGIDRVCHLWTLPQLREHRPYAHHRNAIQHLLWDREPGRAVSVGRNLAGNTLEIVVFDIASGDVTARPAVDESERGVMYYLDSAAQLRQHPRGFFIRVVLDAAGDLSATCAGNTNVPDVITIGGSGVRDALELNGHADAVTAMSFLARGRRLVSVAMDATLRVWTIPVPREDDAGAEETGASDESIDESRDESSGEAGEEFGDASRLESSDESSDEDGAHREPIRWMGFVRGGRELLTLGTRSERYHDVVWGRPEGALWTLPPAGTGTIEPGVARLEGRRIPLHHVEQPIRGSTDEQGRVLVIARDIVSGLTIANADNGEERLFLGGALRTMRPALSTMARYAAGPGGVVDVRDGSLVREPRFQAGLDILEFSPDARYLVAFSSRDPTGELLDLVENRQHAFRWEGTAAVAAAFQPAGEQLAIVTASELHVFDMTGLQPRARVALDYSPSFVAFTGRRLVVGGGREPVGQVDLFDKDGNRLTSLLLDAPVTALCADSNRVAVASGDMTLFLIAAEPHDPESAGATVPVELEPDAAVETGDRAVDAAVTPPPARLAMRTPAFRRVGARVTMAGHNAEVLSVSFARDGRILTTSQDGTVRLWESNGRLARVFRGHHEPVTWCLAAHDGVHMLSSTGQRLRVWDLNSGRALAWRSRLDSSAGMLTTASGDLACLYGEGIELWRPADAEAGGDAVTVLEEPADQRFACACFSGDGRTLVAASGPEAFSRREAPVQLRAWDVASGELLWDQRDYSTPPAACALSPVRPELAMVFGHGFITVYDIPSWTPVNQTAVRLPETGRGIACQWAPDGSWLVVGFGHEKSPIRIYDGESLSPRLEVPGIHWAIAPDGKSVAITHPDNTVTLWETTQFTCLGRVAQHAAAIHGCAISADGATLGTASADRTAKLWNVDELAPIQPPRSQSHKPRPGIWQGFERVFANRLWAYSAAHDAVIRASGGVRTSPDASIGQLVIEEAWEGVPVVIDDAASPEAIAISSDGKLLASIWERRSSSGGMGSLKTDRRWTLRVIDVATGTVRAELETQDMQAGVAFAPAGNAIATAGERLLLREGTAWSDVREFVGQAKPLLCCAFSPSGAYVAGGVGDSSIGSHAAKEIVLWDVGSGDVVWRAAGKHLAIGHLAFSADGERLLSATAEHVPDFVPNDDMLLWNAYSGAPVGVVPGHPPFALSPDSTLLACATDRHTVPIVRLADASRATELRSHGSRICALEYTPDGRWLLSASSNGDISVWDAVTFDELARLTTDLPIRFAAWRRSWDEIVIATEAGDVAVIALRF